MLFLELGRKLMRLPQENGTIVYDLGDFGFSNMVRRACRRHRSHNGVVQCSHRSSIESAGAALLHLVHWRRTKSS